MNTGHWEVIKDCMGSKAKCKQLPEVSKLFQLKVHIMIIIEENCKNLIINMSRYFAFSSKEVKSYILRRGHTLWVKLILF